MKGVLLAKNIVRGKNLIGFEDGSVQLVSDLVPLPEPGEWEYLQLPPREFGEGNNAVVIRKIGPYQSGDAMIMLRRFRNSQGFEFVGAYDTAEQIWAYVTGSFQQLELALTH